MSIATLMGGSFSCKPYQLVLSSLCCNESSLFIWIYNAIILHLRFMEINCCFTSSRPVFDELPTDSEEYRRITSCYS